MWVSGFRIVNVVHGYILTGAAAGTLAPCGTIIRVQGFGFRTLIPKP